MSGSILIAVSDGFGGYGDFLFALKLAEQITKYYVDLLGLESAPTVKLISQASGQQKIKNFKGDIEFNVEVLTPDELQEKIEKKALEVVSIIEGPVFRSSLIQRINKAIQKQAYLVPLIMIPEYAYSSASQRHGVENQRKFRKKALDKIVYLETIYTGFNAQADEKGIILSDMLINPEQPATSYSKLEEKLSRALLNGKAIETHQTNTELYLQYSHDTFPTIPKTSAAERFLKIHRIFTKNSKKNQDILMVGKTERTKRDALEQVKKQLITDGFTKISFYNAETGKEEYLFGEHHMEGRHYRVVYSSGISHVSMIAAQALSGDLVGATGDQSFAEAISGDKILIYECLGHKQLLKNEYYDQLTALDPLCSDTLNLLKNAESESDYNHLQALLTDEMKARLKKLSECFKASVRFTTFTAHAATPARLLSQQIISGKISPYDGDPNSTSSFEKTLMFGNFDAVNHVLDCHTATLDDRQKFCEILTKKNSAGNSLLSLLRNAKLSSLKTTKASYLVTQFSIDKYHAPPNSKRETMFNAYKELVSTFMILGAEQYDEDALIGLMLLTTKNISKEYVFFSPRKGLFFGSKFYSNLEDTLKNLGISLKKITPQQRQRYYAALAQVMENNPNVIANEYILNSLSLEANITQPKIPPLLSNIKATELLLSKKLSDADPTIFPTKTGVYKTHPVPLGQGSWGSVYAARYYAHDAQDVKISRPLAIKMMPLRHKLAMDKERHMFAKVYPNEYFERFNTSHQACLSMPLFSGVRLKDYLNHHLALDLHTRKKIVWSLLDDLQKIHSTHITHNDLKPQNILYDPALKKIHIIDFGCAENIGTMLKYQNVNTAVFAFEMPAEYMRGAKANPSMDIFALTAVIAEILGANKKEFVSVRLMHALSKIDNAYLVQTIKQAFETSESLELALFTKPVQCLIQTKDFNFFVNHYVNCAYDFSPYAEMLGHDVIELLNIMQHQDPAKRPSIADVLDRLKHKKAEEISKVNG